MSDPDGIRLKRLRLRSRRRGTKEMDLILGGFADDRLADLAAADLETYEMLLEENDQDLYRWVSGQAAAPDRLGPLVQRITAHMARAGGMGRT